MIFFAAKSFSYLLESTLGFIKFGGTPLFENKGPHIPKYISILYLFVLIAGRYSDLWPLGLLE